MELPNVRDLAELNALDRNLIHLFVCGPGEGEGIAVALPGSGWMFVDGCRTIRRGPERFPLEVICKRFRSVPDEPVELMALTHPHADHTHGFAELIEEFAPARVGLVGTLNPLRTLADEAREFDRSRMQADPSVKLRAARVGQVLRAIDAWADRGNEVLALNDGVRPLERDALTVDVRAPDSSLYAELRDRYGLDAVLGAKANWFSLVLEINYQRCRIVLGGDLPSTHGSRNVPTGWNLVMGRHGGLVYHHGLKVPHHGSREAIHPELMGTFAANRAWCITPFNSSSLPCTDDNEGLDEILAAQSPIMLTALSLSRKLQAACDEGRVTRTTLAKATLAIRRGELFKSDDTVWRASTALEPLDPVWCVAFDNQGNIVGRWRGAAAVEVHASANGH